LRNVPSREWPSDDIYGSFLPSDSKRDIDSDSEMVNFEPEARINMTNFHKVNSYQNSFLNSKDKVS